MIKPVLILSSAFLMAATIHATAAELTVQTAASEAQPIKRTPLQRFDVPNVGYEAVIGIAEIAPDTLVGRHTHPGPESGYVIEGSFVVLIDSEAPRELKAGDSYLIPSGVIHDAQTGADGGKVIATYIIEKVRRSHPRRTERQTV